MEMEDFVVFEEGEGIAAAIRRGLSRARPGAGERGEGRPALVVVSPKAAGRGELSLPGLCRAVLLPGDAAALLSGRKAVSAVSYGASPRDTLTISSREGDLLWAALQRELVALDGRVVERQEFPLPLFPGMGEEGALAAAGALLLLGLPPEALGESWNGARKNLKENQKNC